LLALVCRAGHGRTNVDRSENLCGYGEQVAVEGVEAESSERQGEVLIRRSGRLEAISMMVDSYLNPRSYNSKSKAQQVDRPPNTAMSASSPISVASSERVHVKVFHRFPHQVQSDALAIMHVRLRWIVTEDAIDHNF
jgi:hypothetical protein